MKKFYPFKPFVLCILCMAGQGIKAYSQITTLAGRQTYLGDYSPAVNAGLFGAYALARDTSGNMYIATASDNRIRRVDAVTQIITTVAGTGVAGYSGDGGTATAAQLNFTNVGIPGLAVDKRGNIYIGDYNNNRIRKIDAQTHTITTIAGNNTGGGYSGDGGLATFASLSGPAGVAVDTAGNVFFVDNGNDVVRRIDATTNKISTVAGNGSSGYTGDGGLATNATLNSPERLAVDDSSNLYIADEYNYVIRKVSAVTKKISTIAGIGSSGFSGDGGLATSAEINNVVGITIDATTGDIYFADQGNNRIRKITASTQKISTIAGTGAQFYVSDGVVATTAPIGKPSDVQVDKAGNIYIDDFLNNRIRKVSATNQIISTIAGDGTDGFTGVQASALQAQLNPQSVAYSPNGELIIADGYYYDIRSINTANTAYIYAGSPNPDPAFASKGTPANGVSSTAALFNAPLGVVTDANNNVYIADVFNNVVRVIDYNTKKVTNYAGSGTAGYSGDGGLATAANLNAPYGIAIDKKGNVYIADALNNRLRVVNASTKKITTIAGVGSAGSEGDNGPATSAQLNFPNAVAVDTAGNVFLLDKGNKSVRKITAATGFISTIFSNGHIFSGIATDVAGNIFVTDSTSSTIVRISKKDYSSQVVAGNGTTGYSGDNGPAIAAQLNNPKGLYIDSHNYIYVADLGNNVVRKIIMGTLPVTLVNFTAQKNKNGVLLQWSTATETQNDHFDIERKGGNGSDWQAIGSLPGHSTSSILQDYAFTDAAPVSGNNYYRLKQVDANGNFTYSPIRTVNIGINWAVKAYPNPTRNNLALDFVNDIDEEASLVIYNAAGHVVLAKQQPVIKGFNHIVLGQLQPWAAGVYFIKLTTKANTYQSKFIKAGE